MAKKNDQLARRQAARARAAEQRRTEDRLIDTAADAVGALDEARAAVQDAEEALAQAVDELRGISMEDARISLLLDIPVGDLPRRRRRNKTAATTPPPAPATSEGNGQGEAATAPTANWSALLEEA